MTQSEEQPSGGSFQRMMEPIIPWMIVGLLGFTSFTSWSNSVRVAELAVMISNLQNSRDVQMLALEKRVDRLEDKKGGIIP